MSELRRGHSKTTPVRTTPKKNNKKESYQNLTSEKYLNVKLDFSEQKKMTMERTIEIKNERIKQLERQIRENQQLVANTIQQWKKYKQDVELSGKRQISSMQSEIEQMNKKFDHLQSQLLEKEMQNKKIGEKNQKLEAQKEEWKQKCVKLQKKYRQDKKQWRQTCILVNSLIDFIKSLPPEIMNSSDLSF